MTLVELFKQCWDIKDYQHSPYAFLIRFGTMYASSAYPAASAGPQIQQL
jgi:hypothetical protein